MRGATLLVALTIGLLSVATVSAHAEPVRVKPGDGALVTSPPLVVEIEMSQDMARKEGANDIYVLDSAGVEVTAVAAVIDKANRRRLTVPMPSRLAIGKYSVRWKTLSADDGDPAGAHSASPMTPADSRRLASRWCGSAAGGATRRPE